MTPSLLALGLLAAAASRALGEEATSNRTCWGAREQLHGAWRDLLAADTGSVTLLGFQGTIMESVQAVSLRKTLSPFHLHRGATVKYTSSEDIVHFVQTSQEAFGGKIGMNVSIEGTFSDVEGPHLLTANLKGMYYDLKWDGHSKQYTLCLDRAGYITDLRSDENYSRWGQDVEALLAGAAVTALVSQLYSVAQLVQPAQPAQPSQWSVCPLGSSDPHLHAPHY